LEGKYMTRTIEQMQADIKRLEAAIRDVIEANKEAGRKAMAAFTPEYQWSVVWNAPHKVRVDRKLTDESAAERQAIIDAHPGMYVSNFGDPTKWEGMEYTICRGNFIEGSGGTCVLEAGSFSRHRQLTDDELAALEAGQVLDSLKWKPGGPY
jgi:hypothetical protein